MWLVNTSLFGHDVDSLFLFLPFARSFLVKCRFRLHPPNDTCPKLESGTLESFSLNKLLIVSQEPTMRLDGRPLRGCGHFGSKVRMDPASIEAKLSLLDS